MTVQFTLKDLKAAGERYHRGPDGKLRIDEMYKSLLLGTRDSTPWKRVSEAERFVRVWGGSLPYVSKGRATRTIMRFAKTWGDQLSDLSRLPLQSLSETQLDKVGELFLHLRGAREKPSLGAVPSGKLLHFFMPDTVLLWDNLYVRGPLLLEEWTYLDGSRPESEKRQFVALQRFGRKLLHRFKETGTRDCLEVARVEHSVVAQCDEPLTRMLDHIFYDREGIRERAILSVGGLEGAVGHYCPDYCHCRECCAAERIQ